MNAQKSRISFVAVVVVLVAGLVLPPAALYAGSETVPSVPALPALQQGQAEPSPDVLLSRQPGMEESPAVAYNSNAHEFLVVWGQQRTNGDIYGQRYSDGGLPLGDNFAISTSGALSGGCPAASYALGADVYLVVWQEEIGGGLDLYGRLYDGGEGGFLTDPFVVEAGTGVQGCPDAEFDGNRWLVVWSTDEAQIYARLVQTDGTVEPDLLTIGGSDQGTRSAPAVAYNAPADLYLVVYGAEIGDVEQIVGRRVHPNGTVLGSEYTINAETGASCPDVAAASWEAYVVVWSDRRSGDFQDHIYGRVVLPDYDGQFDGASFGVSDEIAQQLVPSIARSPTTGYFLVAWSDNRRGVATDTDLFVQRLEPDANLFGQNYALTEGPQGEDRPAIASSQGPDIYFVAYEQDQGYQARSIYGQRVAVTGSLVWHEFSVSAQLQEQTEPDVAFNPATGEYRTVWESVYGEIYTQRLDGDGQPLEGPIEVNLDPSTVGLEPAVGVGGSYSTLVGRDLYNNGLFQCTLYDVPSPAACQAVPGTYGGGDTPDVAYASGQDVYLAVWQQDGRIYGGLYAPGEFIAAAIELSHDTTGAANPRAIYSRYHSVFYVIWDEDMEGQPGIKVRIVTPDGELISTPVPLIGGDGLARTRPVVMYNSTDDNLLTVYERTNGAEVDIYGWLFEWTLAPISTDEIVIRSGAAGVAQEAPDAIYVPGRNRYFVLWQDGATMAETGYDLYGRWLEADGSLAGIARPFFRYAADQTLPMLAFDEENGQALAVWQDARRATSDVYARLGALDVTPPKARFLRMPSAGRTGTTFRLDATPSRDDLTPRGTVMVRWDLNGDGTWETDWTLDKVVAVTPPAPGTYTVTVEARDMLSHTATVQHAIVVIDGDNTPPTATLTADTIYPTAGTAVALDATGSTDAETPAGLEARWDWESDGEWDTGWSGELTATHVFTQAGEQLVLAEVADDGGLTDAAGVAVTVQPDAAAGLEVLPPYVTMGPGGVIAFRARAWDGYGNVMGHPPVTWSVAEPPAGTIDASGVFTAGVRSGEYADAVVASWLPLTAAGTVQVLYPYTVYLPLAVKGY